MRKKMCLMSSEVVTMVWPSHVFVPLLISAEGGEGPGSFKSHFGLRCP